MNLSISTTPLFHYTLPSELVPGAVVNYHIQYGFKAIKWTGIVSSFADNKLTVRLGDGPFRGFTASHQFVSEGVMTAYGIYARKNTRDIMLAVEAQKKTQSLESLDQSATAG